MNEITLKKGDLQKIIAMLMADDKDLKEMFSKMPLLSLIPLMIVSKIEDKLFDSIDIESELKNIFNDKE